MWNTANPAPSYRFAILPARSQRASLRAPAKKGPGIPSRNALVFTLLIVFSSCLNLFRRFRDQSEYRVLIWYVVAARENVTEKSSGRHGFQQDLARRAEHPTGRTPKNPPHRTENDIKMVPIPDSRN